MTVQTCTKRMPASVLQHPAGQWWNLDSVPPIIYTSLRLVSSAFFQKLLQDISYSLLLNWLCFLVLCPWHHTG